MGSLVVSFVCRCSVVFVAEEDVITSVIMIMLLAQRESKIEIGKAIAIALQLQHQTSIKRVVTYSVLFLLREASSSSSSNLSVVQSADA